MTAPPPPIFQVGHLERVPLGTPYPGIVAHVGRLLTKLPGNPELVIDFTGVGKAGIRHVRLLGDLPDPRADHRRETACFNYPQNWG